MTKNLVSKNKRTFFVLTPSIRLIARNVFLSQYCIRHIQERSHDMCPIDDAMTLHMLHVCTYVQYVVQCNTTMYY